MVLEKLGTSLRSTLEKVKKSLFVDEKLVDEVLRDIQRALLQSDVQVQLVFTLTKKIKERALKEETPGLDKKEALVKIVYEELAAFLGEEPQELVKKGEKVTIMLVGLYGAGKTTTCGKLAKYYAKRGHKPCVVGLDVYRPAAMKQLQQVAERAGVPCYTTEREKDPKNIWKTHEKAIKKHDVVLVDSAGRDALSDDLIKEIEQLTTLINPDQKLLVLGADIGQAAQQQAKQFHESCKITGVIVTKMEGTAKGGGALTACSVTEAPIVFLGIGEQLEDLEVFHPQRFVSRLLGMGDIETLLEKAKDALSEEDAEDLGKKLMKGQFSLRDLYEQMEAMKKMGSLSKLMEMVPGMSQIKMPKEALDVQEGKLEKWKFIMDSCTSDELEDPDDVMNGERIERIAKGSGTSTGEVRDLLKQYKKSKKMVKMLGGNEKKMEKMMQKMQGMKG